MRHLKYLFNELTQSSLKAISRHSFFDNILKYIENDDELSLRAILQKSCKDWGTEFMKNELKKMDEFGNTCLYHASLKKKIIFAMLLEFGANPNIPRTTGIKFFAFDNYILEQEISRKNISKIKLLLIYGADPSLCNINIQIRQLYAELFTQKISVAQQIKILRENIDSNQLITSETTKLLFSNLVKLGQLWLVEMEKEDDKDFKKHYYHQAIKSFEYAANMVTELPSELPILNEFKKNLKKKYCLIVKSIKTMH